MTASASQFYVAGPTTVFVGTGTASALEFLGWTDGSVEPDFEGDIQRVSADFAGNVSADAQFMGEEATISITLSKFRYACYTKLRARTASAASITAGMSAGTTGTGATTGSGIGTLMALEGAAVALIFASPYVAKSAFSTDMSPGLNFGIAWVDGRYSSPMGAKVGKPRITFRAIPSWALNGSGVLFTQTIPSLPALT